MKTIKRVNKPDDCRAKLWMYAEECAHEGRPLAPGSIVECDCGEQYELIDDQRDGQDWKLHYSSRTPAAT